MIPGRLLHRVATWLCSADIRARVIDALIADCQYESIRARSRAGRVLALARLAASWTFLVKKQPSVVEAPH